MDKKLSVEERIRAVEIVTELFGGITPILAAKVLQTDPSPELAARVIWALSRSNPDAAGRKILIQATYSKDPWVLRSAWEALSALPTPLQADEVPDWNTGLDHPERRVRSAAILTAGTIGKVAFGKFQSSIQKTTSRVSLAILRINGPKDLGHYFQTCLEVFGRDRDPVIRLEAVRLLQIALGDVVTAENSKLGDIGYAGTKTNGVDISLRRDALQKLAAAFPTGDRPLDLETARLLAMLGEASPALLGKITGQWSRGSSFQDDVHYLMVLAHLPGQRSAKVTRATAKGLNGLLIKLTAKGAQPVDRMSSVLEDLFEELMRRDSNLAAALVADQQFGHPGHAIFTLRLPAREKPGAVRKLLKALSLLDEDDARAAWNPDLVGLTAVLPDAEALPILRARFRDRRLSDSIALILAEKSRPEDRPRLVEALGSTQPRVIAAAARGLLSLAKKSSPSGKEIGIALLALRRLQYEKNEPAAVRAVLDLLSGWTGQKIGLEEKSPDAGKLYLAWLEWFRKAHPREADFLAGLGGTDPAAWKKRLERIDWTKGDIVRGLEIFLRKNCFRCHADARRLGPDLNGIAQRFSRDDLFAAIIDPSKDIAPSFRPFQILTRSGKVYNGMLIYESQEMSLLQTSPDVTVRLSREEVQLVQPGNVSFMPAGLLDDLPDGGLADLYAYLKSLRKK